MGKTKRMKTREKVACPASPKAATCYVPTRSSKGMAKIFTKASPGWSPGAKHKRGALIVVGCPKGKWNARKKRCSVALVRVGMRYKLGSEHCKKCR